MPMATSEDQRRYQREWRARRRAEYFDGKFCSQCGSSDALELDHLDPTTKISNAIWSWSRERRKIELAKCQILCHSCHAKKTIAQRIITHGAVAHRHGSKSMYRDGCRCGLCRLWKKNKNAKYRKSA